MEIKFREFDPFDLWIWIEFENVPSEKEKSYLEEVFNSWFYLGKLGGFNAENLQIQETGIDISYMNYDHNRAEQNLLSPMHNMGQFQYLGTWGRCWFDLGTSDLIAIDILINSLRQLNEEYLIIKELIIGGRNPDWEIDEQNESKFIVNYHN
jgi:hypothetical protein